MQPTTIIFDMDGLLIDSEPLWGEAADEVFSQYGFSLTQQQHQLTTGLRTREFLEWWFQFHQIDLQQVPIAEAAILETVVEKVRQYGKPMPGVEHIINFCLQRHYKIGLATSSGQALINVVVEKLGIGKHLHATASAEQLPFGKPHPQVYLNCAEALNSHPTECLCFEDSFNGMIAAKAARMKCVVVPAPHDQNNPRFQAADLRLSSLQNFNDLLLESLS